MQQTNILVKFLLCVAMFFAVNIAVAHPQDQAAVCVRDVPELVPFYRDFWHCRRVLFTEMWIEHTMMMGEIRGYQRLLYPAATPEQLYKGVPNIQGYYDALPATPICDLAQKVREGKLTGYQAAFVGEYLNGKKVSPSAQEHLAACELTRAVWSVNLGEHLPWHGHFVWLILQKGFRP